jgi:hypothetical protein
MAWKTTCFALSLLSSLLPHDMHNTLLAEEKSALAGFFCVPNLEAVA